MQSPYIPVQKTYQLMSANRLSWRRSDLDQYRSQVRCSPYMQRLNNKLPHLTINPIHPRPGPLLAYSKLWGTVQFSLLKGAPTVRLEAAAISRWSHPSWHLFSHILVSSEWARGHPQRELRDLYNSWNALFIYERRCSS